MLAKVAAVGKASYAYREQRQPAEDIMCRYASYREKQKRKSKRQFMLRKKRDASRAMQRHSRPTEGMILGINASYSKTVRAASS